MSDITPKQLQALKIVRDMMPPELRRQEALKLAKLVSEEQRDRWARAVDVLSEKPGGAS